MQKPTNNRLLSSTIMLSIAAAALSATGAQAQESDDEVVVTGTRIKRPDLTSNSPVELVDSEELSITGTVNVETLLNELPQVLPGFTKTSNNPGSGTATVDLRGLGPARTLVLVDGKRFISSAPPDQSSAAGVVDLNNIPVQLIERVDVVTGGASAVYGSDAIAGVVNFILKDDFEGAQLDVTYDTTDQGDAETVDYSLTLGANFEGGKGNVTFNVTYTDRQPLFRGDRDFLATEFDDDGAGGLVASGSLTNPNGSITDTFDGRPDGITFNANGTPRTYLVPQDLYNFAPTNYVQLPQKRWTFTATGNYEILPNVEFYARASFANNQVPTQLAPTPIADFFTIDLNNNPFVNAQTRTLILDPANDFDGNGLNDFDDDFDGNDVGDADDTDGVVTSLVRLRLPESTPRISDHENNVFQFVGGFRGDLSSFFEGWDYDISAQYGRSNNDATFSGDASKALFQQGLNAVAGPGGPVCIDTSNGCVAINFFGPGNFTPAMYNFIKLSGAATSVSQQTVVTGSVTGDLGALKSPFADTGIDVALGAEYRQEKLTVSPDNNFATGNILGFDPIAPVRGQFDVSEFFAEVRVPLVEGQPFMQSLVFDGGYRYSDYSTAGEVDTFKLGGEWAPVDDIRFRGLFQRAVRAPNIFELFSPQSDTQEGGNTDPCSNSNAAALAASAALRAICVSTGVPTALVGVLPDFAANQAPIKIGGNPNLGVETSDTYTIGAVFQPSVVPGLSVTVDYFSIELTDAISGLFGSAQAVLDSCYNPGASSAQACAAITRRSNGQIDTNGGIDQRNANIAAIETSGVDLGVNYGFDLARLTGMGALNTLDWNLTVSWLEKYEVTSNPTATPIKCEGTFGDPSCGATPQPEWKFVNTVNYALSDAWTINGRWAYTGEVLDSRVRDGTPANTIATPSIDGKNYFDIAASYSPTEWAQIRFGAQNVTDEDYPIIGDVDEQSNGFPTVYTPYGRQFFVALRLKR
jgi:outer membrane receptor protein involved in Fe transport